MALDFVASGDKLTTASFAVPTAVTFTAWVKDVDFTTSSGPRILENATGPTTRWFLDSADGSIVYQRLFSTTAEWRASLGSVDWSQWHHLAVTHNAANASNDPIFYLDGVPLTLSLDNNSSGAAVTTSSAMTIGNRPSDGRPLGTLAWLGIYSTVLSQGQIRQAMDSGATPGNQFALYGLEVDGATFVDLSGSGLTATKVGTPTFLSGPPLNGGPSGVPIVDTFNRADGTLGSPWTNITGTGDVISNTAGDTGAWLAQYGTTDYTNLAASFRVATLPANLNRYQLYYRYDPGSQNGYRTEFYRDDSQTDYWITSKIVGGVATSLMAGTTQELAVGDSLGIFVLGDSISLMHRPAGGVWTVIDTVTDTTYSAGGKVAIGAGGSTARLDNFALGEISGPVGFESKIPALLGGPIQTTAILPGEIDLHFLSEITVEPGDEITPPEIEPSHISPHYTIRAFRPGYVQIPITSGDESYHSEDYWASVSMPAPGISEGFARWNENWISPGLTMDDMDLLTMNELDTFMMFQLEESGAIGYEVDWDYAPRASITVGTDGLVLQSTYEYDNLMRSPFNGAGPYFIELILRDFPAQSDPEHLDLDNSFVTFIDRDGAINRIPFSDSLEDLTAGGNVPWRINRDQLDQVDLEHIRRINIELIAEGGDFVFACESMRLMDSSYDYPEIAIDTKAGWLVKNPSRIGSSVPDTQAEVNDILIDGQPVKNVSEVINFHIGQLDTDPHTLFVFLRYDEDQEQFIAAQITITASSTSIELIDNEGAGVFTTQAASFGGLTENSDYYLILTAENERFKAQIYRAIGFTLGTKLMELSRTVVVTESGQIGLSFDPSHYDLGINFMYPLNTSIATYESKAFRSLSPVAGVSLYPNSSNQFPILNAENFVVSTAYNPFNSALDEDGLNQVVLTVDSSVTDNSPTSFRVQKHRELSYIGGIEYDGIITVNDLAYTSLTGSIRFDNYLDYGKFAVVLFDKHGQNVAFFAELEGLVPNKWNSFRVPFTSQDSYLNEFILQIVHIGALEDSPPNEPATASFYLDNIQLEHLSILWEASNDGGDTYLRFNDTINKRYQGVVFPEPGPNVLIRARALTSQAWISGYQLVPHYAKPGKLIPA
jgi:hypothetical protein